jgi:hypothetical protein
MDQQDNSTPSDQPETIAPVRGVSRRAVLSGAKAAVPAIVTLYSGAALANSSSNLVTVDPQAGTVNGKYNCLDTEGLDWVRERTYHLGEPPLAHVSRINGYDTFYKPGLNGQPSSTRVYGPEMCARGGDYYKKTWYSGFKKVNVKKGGMLSGTAMASFSNVTTYTDV